MAANAKSGGRELKFSLCMIVKDEEGVLGRCLESAEGLADEIVVADTGSADRTREIAAKYTDKIFSFAWTDDFSAARNFSFSKGSGDYLFWLDADDVIPPPSRDAFFRLKERLSALPESALPDTILCPYDAGADCTYLRERFVRRASFSGWQGCVHECITPENKTEISDFRVGHRPAEKSRGSRNLDIYRKNIARGYAMNARDKYYYGRELYHSALYTEAAAMLREMLADPAGWAVNKIDACRILARCRIAAGKREEGYEALFHSLSFGEPRASALNEIADLFAGDSRPREAIWWYSAALNCRSHAADGDFESPFDLSLRPLLGLTVCLWETGDKAGAVDAHRRAAALFPDHPAVRFNEDFFHARGLL